MSNALANALKIIEGVSDPVKALEILKTCIKLELMNEEYKKNVCSTCGQHINGAHFCPGRSYPTTPYHRPSFTPTQTPPYWPYNETGSCPHCGNRGPHDCPGSGRIISLVGAGDDLNSRGMGGMSGFLDGKQVFGFLVGKKK